MMRDPYTSKTSEQQDGFQVIIVMRFYRVYLNEHEIPQSEMTTKTQIGALNLFQYEINVGAFI